jgi:hypothetical protein
MGHGLLSLAKPAAVPVRWAALEQQEESFLDLDRTFPGAGA